MPRKDYKTKRVYSYFCSMKRGLEINCLFRLEELNGGLELPRSGWSFGWSEKDIEVA